MTNIRPTDGELHDEQGMHRRTPPPGMTGARFERDMRLHMEAHGTQQWAQLVLAESPPLWVQRLLAEWRTQRVRAESQEAWRKRMLTEWRSTKVEPTESTPLEWERPDMNDL